MEVESLKTVAAWSAFGSAANDPAPLSTATSKPLEAKIFQIPEILLHVFRLAWSSDEEVIQHQQFLSQVALVSRNWNGAATTCLYEELEVMWFFNRAVPLYDALMSDSGVRNLVRGIRVWYPPFNYWDRRREEEDRQSWMEYGADCLMDKDKAVGEWEFNRADITPASIRTLFDILSILPNVQHVVLAGFSARLFPALYHPTEFKLSNSTVTSLHLFDMPQRMIDCLSTSYSSASNLIIFDCNYASHLPQTHHIPKFTRHLHLNFPNKLFYLAETLPSPSTPDLSFVAANLFTLSLRSALFDNKTRVHSNGGDRCISVVPMFHILSACCSSGSSFPNLSVLQLQLGMMNNPQVSVVKHFLSLLLNLQHLVIDTASLPELLPFVSTSVRRITAQVGRPLYTLFVQAPSVVVPLLLSETYHLDRLEMMDVNFGCASEFEIQKLATLLPRWEAEAERRGVRLSVRVEEERIDYSGHEILDLYTALGPVEYCLR